MYDKMNLIICIKVIDNNLSALRKERTMIFFLIGLFVLLVFILFTGIRIVPQAHEYVVEFLGKYKTTWSAGIHFLVSLF